ncbi:MAG: CPXCG motif-containing cysteine-rich protein [Alteromonadaceae bacterium]|nr:CPXCG motif-containing cysteine-rich protein [Alteromonadaceae bacterium]
MSLSEAESFSCPYCMVINDIEVDLSHDINQTQIVDCQICCQPIEVQVIESMYGIECVVRREDE